MNDKFWQLVDKYLIPYWELSKICHAPIKILLLWYDEGAPDDALAELENYLGLRT